MTGVLLNLSNVLLVLMDIVFVSALVRLKWQRRKHLWERWIIGGVLIGEVLVAALAVAVQQLVEEPLHVTYPLTQPSSLT